MIPILIDILLGYFGITSLTIFSFLFIKKDYLDTLKKCHKVTMAECKNTSVIRKFGRLLIRMFAPLL